MGRKYSITRSGITTVDAGDFFQLRNISGRRVKIFALTVFQTGTTLLLPGIRLTRGTGGTGGTDRTSSIRLGDDTDSAAGITAFERSFTADVGGVTWDALRGWNVLQEFSYLPIPAIQISMPASAHLGIGLVASQAISNVGIMIDWEEIGV